MNLDTYNNISVYAYIADCTHYRCNVPLYGGDYSTVISQSVEGHFEHFDGGSLQISWVAKMELLLYHSLHQKVELLVKQEGGMCVEVKS